MGNSTQPMARNSAITGRSRSARRPVTRTPITTAPDDRRQVDAVDDFVRQADEVHALPYQLGQVDFVEYQFDKLDHDVGDDRPHRVDTARDDLLTMLGQVDPSTAEGARSPSPSVHFCTRSVGACRRTDTVAGD
jgi:hypothetical protein